MGYLISAHVMRHAPDTARFNEVPASIGIRTCFHRAARIFLVDAFRRSKVPEYPFQTLLPTADLDLEFPATLRELSNIYTHLARTGDVNGLKRSYVSFSRLLSRLLEQPVLSFVADDDGLDFACVTDRGELTRLRCRCEDLIIEYDSGATQIVPLMLEEEDDEFLTDLAALATAAPGVSVLPRETPADNRLHGIAMDELARFSGVNEPILGLGSWDPPTDDAAIREWQRSAP